MRIEPAAWTGMAIARCLASAASGRWTPTRLAAATGAGERQVRDVLTRLELARLIAWSPEIGGYVLARPVATISVADVVTAASANVAPVPSGPANSASATLTAAVWPSLVEALESVSLAEALPRSGAIEGRTACNPDAARTVH